MKKGIIISIIAVIVLTVIACITLSNTYFSPYEKQIRLAYKYLDEGNYEEAILAFDKAIQIDAKKPKAYIGKADVYITRCDENAITDATAVLKLGYEQSEDNRDEIVKAVIRLSDKLKEKGHEQLAYEFSKIMYEIVSDERIADWMADFIKDYVENTEEPDNKFFVDTFKEIYNITKSDKLVEWLKKYADENLNDPENKFSAEIVDLLNFVYETNKDESIKQIINDNFEAYGRSILRDLYYAYYFGDKGALKNFARQNYPGTNAKSIVNYLEEDKCIWYSETDDITQKGTKGIALYSNGLLYVGEWEDEQFNGSGEYFYGVYVFSGKFKNGSPVGVCEEVIEMRNKDHSWTEFYKGNYVNNVREGAFSYTRTDDDGKIFNFSKINYINGIAQKIGSQRYIGEYTAIARYGDATTFHNYTGMTEYAPGYSAEKMSY